jgi:glycosyltransferase involved in cell wall biosynthesis
MSLLTVFTPTFNRASILPELYKSLLRQTNPDFKWLIVDDGSEDDTEQLVGYWKRKGEVSISYYKQTNQGKHVAFNKGLELCDTPLFFCVDSDDRLTPDAVQRILDIHHEERENEILGIYMRKGDFAGNPLGINWPTDCRYVHLNELYQRYGYKGEAAIILKTEKIKKYAFPQFKNEKFIREIVFYDQINEIAPMRLDNAVCYLFEYRPDGYTTQNMKLEFSNPVGTGYNYLHHVNYTSGIVAKSKHMGMFYAWKQLMQVEDLLYKTIRIPMYIKLTGRILKWHYIRLFKQHRRQFE